MSYKYKPKSEYLKRAYSKQTLSTFTPNTQAPTVYADFSFEAVLKMVDNDPVARGAVNHFVDKCMEGDYAIVTRDTNKYDRETEMTLDEKYMFRTNILRKSFLTAKLFNNVFIEIVRDTENKTKSINVMDTMIVDPITAPNGDAISYRSKIPDTVKGEYTTWNKNDITWIKYNDRTAGFAPVDLKALWENLLAKDYLRQYIGWLWKTGQYRLIYNFKNGASDKDVVDFLVYLRKNQDNPSAPLIAKGEMEATVLRDMKETESLVQLLDYYDNQTLILLRVPPTDAGVRDASGRASSDSQSNNFTTSVVGLRKLVEDFINFDLFPKISKGNTLLRFAPVDRFFEKKVIEIIQVFKSLGMTNDAMIEYLQDNGMYFKAEKVFEDVPDPNELLTQGTAISRMDKGAGEGNKKKETVSTREDQVKK